MKAVAGEKNGVHPNDIPYNVQIMFMPDNVSQPFLAKTARSIKEQTII